MRWIVLALFVVGFVSGVEVDFDCPDEIFAGEEFECLLEVDDGDGIYDVKIDLDGERNSVLKTWNDGTWKSGYFYLKEFVESGDERDIRLRISEEGEWDGELKLRQGSNREFFDIEMEVLSKKEEVVKDEILDDEIVLLEVAPEIVLLNDVSVSPRDDSGEPDEVDELIYVSKDARVVDWLPYGFSLFLIFIIGILLWERF